MAQNLIRKEMKISPENLISSRNNVVRGRNFIFDDKGFYQRKGVNTDLNRIMFDYNARQKGYCSIIPTNTYFYLNSQRAKVVILKEWDDLGDIHKELLFKLVFDDGSFSDIGSISLSGFSPGTSANIDSFTLYTGKSVRGCGLFFIVTKSYYKTGEKEIGIYELSKDLSVWTELEGSDMYAPTVLFNGRGESFYIAVNNDPNYKLDDPRYLESKNLLSGAFKSYFTTDGYSFSFSLPFDNLTNEEITCVYKADAERQYAWTVKAGHSFSESVNIEGKEVELYCERQKGRMVFRTKQGELYSLPRSNDANNIWFKAYKTDEENIFKVASMNIATAFRAKSNDCAMTVFAGSSLFPSTVLWIDSKNPLYFPESCQTQIGDEKEKITQLTIQGDNLLAFKEKEVFRGSFVAADGYQIEGILAGVKGSGSIKESGVEFSLEGALPDAPIPRTVKETNGKVLFATTCGGVYSLNGQGGKISEISPIGTFEKPTFATTLEGDYILFCENENFLLWDTKTLKKPLWLEQKYPTKIFDTADFSSAPVLLCTTGFEYSPIIYSLVLSGEEDLYFAFEDNRICLKEKSVEAILELELIKGFSLNRLCKIVLKGKSYFGINLLAKNGEVPFYAGSFEGMLNTVEAVVGGVFSELNVVLGFKGPFRLKDLGCFYRSLKK